MNPPIHDLPAPRYVVAGDDLDLATYTWGDESAPTVVLLHGFASSVLLNFVRTGWTRDLLKHGFRIVALDQRGHGRSGKPHDPRSYVFRQLVDDVLTVLDSYHLNRVALVGYSLGTRVGWRSALDLDHRVATAVLGGIPDGVPLTRFRVDQARAWVAAGTPVEDRITRAYLTMAESLEGNDIEALISLVEGAREGPQPSPADPPLQPVLFATGSEDAILPRSRALAEATPEGRFIELDGRHHFNAPTSRQFRDASVAFLAEQIGSMA